MIGLITRSPFVLVFALLSPLVAIATVLDARRVARRHDRAESQRFDRECVAYEHAIADAHAREREHADVSAPLSGALSADTPLRLGVAPGVSSSAADDVLQVGNSADESRVRGLLQRARQHPALPVLVPRGPIAVCGDGVVAEAIVRRLENEPGVSVTRFVDGQTVATDAIALRVQSATLIDVVVPGCAAVAVRPEFASARQVATLASKRGEATASLIPDAVSWRELRAALDEGAHASTDTSISRRGVPIGVDAAGPVLLDLENNGPHALVGGTTGSGKSEFLRTLALGWVADQPPSAVQLLLVDFKGGASFAGLTELPHTVGLVTDLDPLVAERALRSLRAELRRRERVLSEHGLRDISHRPGVLSRLVVLVDEFAAVIESFPDLHAAFADLSARGRSLGVHLVLCTQHPAGIVRDAVAANCAVRIAFRLSASAGTAFVGAAGRDLVAAQPGRALLTEGDEVRAVHIAAIDDTDIEAVRVRWLGHTADHAPWLPPLPRECDDHELDPHQSYPSRNEPRTLEPTLDAASSTEPDELGELRFGLLDDPDEQRRLAAVWKPARDGALAVMGAPQSGRTNTLAALGAAARRSGASTIVVPLAVSEAWALLEQCAESPKPRVLLIADDLDLLLADSLEHSSELLTRWDSAARAIRRAGGGAVASMGPPSSARSLLNGRFESRLILRATDADEHALAGAPRGLYDREAPPGRGWWLDRQVQVVIAHPAALDATRVPAPEWSEPHDADVLVITRRPALVCQHLRDSQPTRQIVQDLSAEPAVGHERAANAVDLAPRTLVGDPDAWQSAWPLFSAARRRCAIVVVHADAADVRVLIGHRATPPPLNAAEGEVWVVEPGEPLRRRRWQAVAAR